MRALKAMGLVTAAALGPFAVVSAYLLGSKLLPDSLVFPAWLGVVALAVAVGVLCVIRLTTGGWRRVVLTLAYIPVMLSATVLYSFFFTGTVLGTST